MHKPLALRTAIAIAALFIVAPLAFSQAVDDAELPPAPILRTDPDVLWFGARAGVGNAASTGRIYDASPFFYAPNTLSTDPLFQLEGGVVGELRLFNPLVLDAGLGVTTKGRTYSLDEGANIDVLDDAIITETVLYVAAPVVANAELSILPWLRVRGGAGLSVNAAVYRSGTSESVADGEVASLPRTYFASDFPRVFTVSGLVRAGVEFGETSGFGVQLTYEYHLLPDFDFGGLESAHYHSINIAVYSMFVSVAASAGQ